MTPTTDAPFRHFHDQLTALNRRLLAMSEKAEALVELSVEALLAKDEGKAEAVIAADRELDAMELELETAALELLALQQPMARDLRFIVSAIKVTSDLERVGDHAVNIAQAALRLISQRTDIIPDPEIEDMARRARAMLSDAIDAFLRGDGALGRDVCARDDQVGGEQRFAEVLDIAAQIVMPAGRLQVGQVTLAGRMQHMESRAGERVDRRVVDRPRPQ